MKLIMIILTNLCFVGFINAKVFVIIGPSGVGKSTLINKLREDDLQFDDLISHTTRQMRIGEKDGKDYFFINKSEYEKKEKNNEFIISTTVHENLYGISKEYIDEKLKSERNLICSLNTEATKKFKTIFGEKVVTIFIAPPSFDELKKRIFQRNAEEDFAIKIRLKNAHDELVQQDSFDYKIINDNLYQSMEELKKIFISEMSMKLIIKQFVISHINSAAVRAMSYNIRMAPCVEDDGTENAWIHRLPKINMIFNQYMPDIIGIQEVSLQQMNSLEKSLHHLPYKFLGKYPTKKPIESGLGILYNTKKLLLLSEQLHTIWLNESQTQAEAPAWDGSSYERYLIYAKFKSITTGNDFWFITTHFDHLGIKARQESAKIVMDLTEKLDAPSVVTGDFNCFPQLGGQELYQFLCSRSNRMRDSGNIADILFGVPGSWIGWDYDIYKQKEGYAKYDFIFVQDTIKVKQQGIIDDRIWDNNLQKELYPSDHRPVLSDLCI